MKIATYNIWDDEAGMPIRFQQLIFEINGINADIICLQEVADREKSDMIKYSCGYAYSHWQAKAGVSILSKYPIERVFDFEYGTSACVQFTSKRLHIINVHLPWDRMTLREKAIVDIAKHAENVKADFTLLMGDFNSAEDSSVHRFLTNEQSLLGSDACFFDMAEVFAELTDGEKLATLNFRDNPRWGVVQPKNTIEVNQRFDWILLKNPYPAEFPILKDCAIFGTEISDNTCLAASDHYGVIVEIEF